MNAKDRQALQIERLRKFDKAVYDTRINCGETQAFTFTYNGNPDELEGFKIHCKTCTKVKMEGNVFVITYSAPACVDYTENKDRGETQLSYTSSVSVYFKDGQPLQNFNDAGELRENPDKVPVSLQIRSTILI